MVLDITTPVQIHRVNGVDVWVKREDLCSPYPGPAFSKIRGVWAHIARRPESVIGVLDTYHSKAGWAVSYVCQALGKQTVNYWPRYAGDDDRPRQQQREAETLGAELVSLKAGMSAILHRRATADLARRAGAAGYMMPNALQLRESVDENAAELVRTVEAGYLPSTGTMVISISSGTIAAGVLMGLDQMEMVKDYRIVLHMGYSRPVEPRLDYIMNSAGLGMNALAIHHTDIIDEGYAYADAATGRAPFPCNPYYDLKAFRWLEQNLHTLSGPVVFWNIGS